MNGVIKSTCQYRGPKPGDSDYLSEAALDLGVVNQAVDLLFASPEGKDLTGCGIDFAVLKLIQTQEAKEQGVKPEYITCLVEVNDGYSLGRYEGISGKDYTDLLIARWGTLVEALEQ